MLQQLAVFLISSAVCYHTTLLGQVVQLSAIRSIKALEERSMTRAHTYDH